MLKRTSLAILALCATSSAAEAQNRWPNWYIGLNGSVPFVQNTNISQNGSNLGDMELDTGIGAGIAIGYTPNGRTTSPLRYELEYMYRRSDVDSIGTNSNAAGDIRSHAFMFNTYYDFAKGLNSNGLTPYVGAGIGWTSVDLSSSTISVNGKDRSFAYQLMAGVGYEPKSIPNTVWSIGYRYFSAANNIEVDNGVRATTLDYNVHSVEVGGRFRF